MYTSSINVFSASIKCTVKSRIQIISYFFISFYGITSEEFKEWALEITYLFTYEKTSTYYVPSHAKLKHFANGKLWDKYNNLKKLVKKYTHKKVREEEIVEINLHCKEKLLSYVPFNLMIQIQKLCGKKHLKDELKELRLQIIMKNIIF